MYETGPTGPSIERARALLEFGRVLEALVEVRRIIAEKPNDVEALEIEGTCHLKRGEVRAALSSLWLAISTSPARAHSYYLYAHALKAAGDLQAAETALVVALGMAPHDPVYLRGLAQLYSECGRHAEALTLAERALRLEPEGACNYVALGYAASLAKDPRRARLAYERAVALEPANAAAWNNLGCLDLAEGHYFRARRRFRESLRLDPQGTAVRRNLERAAFPWVPDEPTFSGVLVGLMRALVQAKASRLVRLALFIEAPVTGRALVLGGGRGALVSGGLVGLMLSQMGPGAAVPLVLGTAAVGAVWLGTRMSLPEARLRVRRGLAWGRAAFDGHVARWLAGEMEREARDAAFVELLESLALALTDEA